MRGEIPSEDKSLRGIKICGEAPCGFSDAKTSSKDAQERSASIRKLLIAVVLRVIFKIVEVIGGIKSNSDYDRCSSFIVGYYICPHVSHCLAFT